MMEFNVPFSVRDGMPDIYHHWIALDMMSYIRIGMGGRERKDFLRVMNRPNRYISREAVNSVQLSFEIWRNTIGRRTGCRSASTGSGMMPK